MRLILTIVVCFISATSFSQIEYTTDPKIVKEFEKFVKANPDYLMYGPEKFLWEWHSNIKIDSLDFIDEKSPLYSKSDEKYSIYKSDITVFNFIRIDSIDSHLVLFKGTNIDYSLESFFANEKVLKEAGEIFGYIINDTPLLVFGNCAHLFFKKVSTITISSPHAKRVIYNDDPYPISYYKRYLFIFKDGKLQEIKTGSDKCSGYEQQKYYEYVRRNLPKE